MPRTRRSNVAHLVPPTKRGPGEVDLDVLRQAEQTGSRKTTNAFELPSFPKPLEEAVANAGYDLLAQDDAIGAGFSWAAADPFYSAYAEGVAFLGFSYLSTLSQRAEYRVVTETIASEMTREWIELKVASGDKAKNDRVKVIEDCLDNLNAQHTFKKVAEGDGYFGRGHLYLDTGRTDDNEELKLDLGNGQSMLSEVKISPEDGKQKLKKLVPVEAMWAYPLHYNSIDPLRGDWYSPRSWYVMSREVHSSRFLTFIGREVPDIIKPAYAFGGLSMSQMLKPYVDNWLRTRQSVADLIHSFSTNVLKTNLDAANSIGGNKTLKRVALFNAIKNNQGTLVIDRETEDWGNVSAPLGTLDSLQAQTQEHMAAIARIPLVKLLGIQPAGLNASSEGELIAFEDWIAAFQNALFRPALRTIIDLIQLGEWGKVDNDITFDFKSIRQMRPQEEAAYQVTKAQAREAYVGMGAVDAAEVRELLAEDKDSPFQGLDLSQPLPEPPGMGAPPVPGQPGQGEEVEQGTDDDLNGLWYPYDSMESWFRYHGAGDAKFEEGQHPRAHGGTTAGQFVKKGEGEAVPAHIAKLKIPPAWTNVHYHPDPNNHVLAFGRDAKGREQRIYSEKFAKTQSAAKFARIKKLEQQMERIAKKNRAALSSKDKRTADNAAVLGLIMGTGIRPGSERETGAEKKAYGATTLEGRHVTRDEGGNTALRFVGKKGVDLHIPVRDAEIAQMLHARAAQAGAEGKLFPGTSQGSLLRHVKQLSGNDFKTKDFRTLLGTRLAHSLVQTLPAPKTPSEYKKQVKAVAQRVSSALGNTPTIALQSYISPHVFSDWRASSGA